MKLLPLYLPPFCYQILSLKPTYPIQRQNLKNPQPIFSSWRERPSFKPIQNNTQCLQQAGYFGSPVPIQNANEAVKIMAAALINCLWSPLFVLPLHHWHVLTPACSSFNSISANSAAFRQVGLTCGYT